MNNQYNFYNLEASFKNYLVAGKKSVSTINNYSSDLRHFIGWFILNIKTSNPQAKIDIINDSEILSFMNEDSVANYINYLETNHIPVKTINRRLSTLKKFFSFSINQGWINENILNKLGKKGLYTDPVEEINSIIKKYSKTASIEDSNNVTEFFKIINL